MKHLQEIDMNTKDKAINLTDLGTQALDKTIEQHHERTTQGLSFLDRHALNKRLSGQAKGSLVTIGIAMDTFKTNTALTSISIAETKVRAAMVVNAMADIGALAVDVNQKTTAVEAKITMSTIAEMATHYKKMNETFAEIDQAQHKGMLSSDEALRVKKIHEVFTNDDINRALARAGESKDAVSALAAHALHGIKNTTDRLQ
jgi:hypothetical protein